MDIGRWINILYAIVACGAMLVLVDKHRIKQLAPIGLLAAALLFISQESMISLGLIKYPKAVFMIMGIPLFQFLWAFAYGILLISFMKEEWSRKLIIIFGFTLINEILAYIAEMTGNLVFLNNYNIWYDLLMTFVVFSFGVWAAEGLFKDQIYEYSKKYS